MIIILKWTNKNRRCRKSTKKAHGKHKKIVYKKHKNNFKMFRQYAEIVKIGHLQIFIHKLPKLSKITIFKRTKTKINEYK